MRFIVRWHCSGSICLTWSLFAVPLYFILPETHRDCGRPARHHGGVPPVRWSLSITRTYRLDLRAIDSLKGGPPVILAPNHPALIDALLILTRHPNLVCVMKAQLMKNVFLGAGSRLARYVGNDSSRQMIKESVAHLHAGAALLLFPEGTRTTRAPINPLAGSVGLIAKYANVSVQTLLIETDSPFLSKGWPLFKRPELPITYRIRLGKRFDPPADVAAFTEELDQYYRHALEDALQSPGSSMPDALEYSSCAHSELQPGPQGVCDRAGGAGPMGTRLGRGRWQYRSFRTSLWQRWRRRTRTCVCLCCPRIAARAPPCCLACARLWRWATPMR